MIRSKGMRLVEHVACVEKRNNRVLMGKPQLRKPRCRWEDNNKMDCKAVGWEGYIWTGFIWLRMGTTCRFM